MHWTAGHRRGIPRKLDAALNGGKDAVISFLFEHTHQVPFVGCWIWDGPVNASGYAWAIDPRKPFNRARPNRIVLSRLLCEVVYGEMAHWTLEQARHTCDVPACLNPAHIIPGTPQDNADDKMRRGRAADTRGLANGRAKLTLEDGAAIRELRAKGWSNRRVAALYGIGTSTASRAAIGNHWTAF